MSNLPTLYMPVVSPPTPAPSPGPSSNVFPHIASVSTSHFAQLSHSQRRLFLSALLSECSPDDLLFISSNLSTLLRRDFIRDLPPELALYILGFLDEPTSLLRAGRVSRYWHSLIADDWLWKRLCAVYKFEVQEEWTKPSDTGVSSTTSASPCSTIRHRARHSTGSVPLFSKIIPHRTYRESFRLSYLNCTFHIPLSYT